MTTARTDRPPAPGGRSPRSPADADPSDRLGRLVRSVTGAPAEPGHAVELLENGEEIFPAMLRAIDDAADRVDLLTYVYWQGEIADRFADAAARAARRGARVRILLDAAGATGFTDALDERLTAAGCELRRFRPPRLGNLTRLHHRTHRKLLICDGRVGFTGGVGIADEWAGNGVADGDWRDLHLRLEGSAVAGLEAAFLDNWVDAGGTIAWRDPGPPSHTVDGPSVAVIASPAEIGVARVRSLLVSLIDDADHRIRIASAYLNPDDEVRDTLCGAARRGVQVDLVVPGPEIDKWISRAIAWGHYDELVSAGVRIHEYRPTMYHAKAITIDGSLALLGSPNLNRRSHRLDDEIAVAVLDPSFVARVDRALDDDIERSRTLEASWAGPGSWRHRVGRLTAPLRPHA